MSAEEYLNPDELDHLMEGAGSPPSHRGLLFLCLAAMVIVAVVATQVPHVRGLWYRVVGTPEPVSIPWQTSFESAVAEAADSHRPLLITFISDAPTSFTMVNEVWPSPGVRALVEKSFVPLRLDLREQSSLAAELGVSSAPTILVIRDHKETARFTSYVSAETLEFELRRAIE